MPLPTVAANPVGAGGTVLQALQEPVEVQGAPEFGPRFHRPSSTQVILTNPRLDHGYFVRGSLGYTFGKWYAKATYESRYFKFVADPGNPNNLYNWKSNLISGGVGFAF